MNTLGSFDSLVVNTPGSLNSPVVDATGSQLLGVFGTSRTGLEKASEQVYKKQSGCKKTMESLHPGLFLHQQLLL
jgi:hypothetical protein